jgi:hypothetical protein
MLSPLTGAVDAATPDSEAGRRFSWIVKEFLGDAPRFQLYRAELSQILSDWQSSGASLLPVIDRSPALMEIKPLAKNLSDLGEIGLEAISYLKLATLPTAEWRDSSLAKIEEAAKPYGALEFAVIPSVKELVMAAADQRRLKTSTQTQVRINAKSEVAVR